MVGTIFNCLKSKCYQGVVKVGFAQNYFIGTGGQSGIYYPFGGALAKVWSDEVSSINVKAEVTAASVENTIKVERGDMLADW
ncbi:TAXI family TRAP transporter solute-binding subunit [Thalassotalea sp. G20_0]|uniref:TAXI family TRAP transporter solute-binding subunit n=1 Tax=Thalassotalea sp. G20_0 TaxID=2821093 RepID=UPI002570D094|nr:TAXI family TRAP transporter solute-binding subunit [Thalassotalea sp. G20_0]